MPTLLEFQQAMGRYVLGADDPAATHDIARWCAGPAQAALPCLGIYRGTAVSTLVNALGLSFPAVRRLVGTDFFDATAQTFMLEHRPDSAYLNVYGTDFAQFLRGFVPAAGLAYLGDVAELEWAVNRALHASDVPGLDPARLAALDPRALARAVLVAHPSVTPLRLQCPADAIWRAVLDQDDAAMAAIDPAAGPVWLLVERDAHRRVQVRRLPESAWRLTERLCAGAPLHVALEAALTAGPEQLDSLNALLADHFISGRFIDQGELPS